MRKLYQRVKNWYLGLPWYWKVLGAVVLVLIVALAIVNFIFGGHKDFFDWAKMRKKQNELVDTAVGGYEDQNRVLEKLIKDKKREIAVKINTASNIDAKTLEKRKKLEEATTMEELDKLQEELGL